VINLETKKKKVVKIITLFFIIGIIAVDAIIINYAIIGKSISYNHNQKEFYEIVSSVNALPADKIYNPGEGEFLTIYGKVVELLAPDLSPPRHEKFLITVNNSRNVTVVYNIDYQGRGWLNAKVGDWVVFTGEVFLTSNNKYGIHKIAEDGGFLILYRPSNSMFVEIGYYPPSDNVNIVFLVISNIFVILIWKFRGKLKPRK